MKKCKKTAALLAALVLLLTSVLPASARTYISLNKKIPVIVLSGDGEPLVDKDGNKILKFTNLGDIAGETDNSELYESIANVLQPFLLEGVLFNRWDNYYANLQKEVAELTEGIQLNENGEVDNGSGISEARKQENETNMRTDKKGEKGYYGFEDYHFWYDWRLDPLEVADRLAEYIDAVLAATGASKVSLISRCVGVSVTLSYVAKYGTAKLHGYAVDGSCTNGGEFISDALSGKFKVDGDAIERFLTDYNALGILNVSDFAMASIDLLNKSGALDALVNVSRATIYNKIMVGATSALALSTVFTMPCYWCFVTEEDYETAKRYVFGEEGSEKRAQYAGLIEKLDRYDVTVRQHISELMQSLGQKGVNVAIVSKYGFQMMPICRSAEQVSDEYASVHRSSYGATTSTIYDTLSEDYIAQRTAEGKGKYISPDKQVDASTCLYPDATWFNKGARHGNWTDVENEILYEAVTASRQLTPADLPYSQFIVYDGETDTSSPMTVENCHTENWTADASTDKTANLLVRFFNFLKSLINWYKSLFEMLQSFGTA